MTSCRRRSILRRRSRGGADVVVVVQDRRNFQLLGLLSLLRLLALLWRLALLRTLSLLALLAARWIHSRANGLAYFIAFEGHVVAMHPGVVAAVVDAFEEHVVC